MTGRPSHTGAVLLRGVLLSIALLALFGTCALYGTAAPSSEPQASYPGGHDGGENDPAAWEFTYMYAVSLLAAEWVAGRALVHWRVDRRLLLVPRDRFDSTGERSSG